jgi:hypothetical protein
MQKAHQSQKNTSNGISQNIHKMLKKLQLKKDLFTTNWFCLRGSKSADTSGNFGKEMSGISVLDRTMPEKNSKEQRWFGLRTGTGKRMVVSSLGAEASGGDGAGDGLGEMLNSRDQLGRACRDGHRDLEDLHPYLSPREGNRDGNGNSQDRDGEGPMVWNRPKDMEALRRQLLAPVLLREKRKTFELDSNTTHKSQRNPRTPERKDYIYLLNNILLCPSAVAEVQKPHRDMMKLYVLIQAHRASLDYTSALLSLISSVVPPYKNKFLERQDLDGVADEIVDMLVFEYVNQARGECVRDLITRLKVTCQDDDHDGDGNNEGKLSWTSPQLIDALKAIRILDSANTMNVGSDALLEMMQPHFSKLTAQTRGNKQVTTNGDIVFTALNNKFTTLSISTNLHEDLQLHIVVDVSAILHAAAYERVLHSVRTEGMGGDEFSEIFGDDKENDDYRAAVANIQSFDRAYKSLNQPYSAQHSPHQSPTNSIYIDQTTSLIKYIRKTLSSRILLAIFHNDSLVVTYAPGQTTHIGNLVIDILPSNNIKEAFSAGVSGYFNP